MKTVLFSKKDLVKLIVPLFIESVFSVVVGMADTMMVAQAGEEAVSGVSLVDSVNLLILYFLGALSTGGAIVLSQAIGAGRTKNVQSIAKQLIWASCMAGVLFTAVMVIFRKGLLGLIFGAVSDGIMKHALDYALFTALSFPFLALRNAVGAYYRVHGNSSVSMYITLLVNLLNIGGNAFLIYGYGMGAKGAAIATLFARFIGAAITLALVFHKKTLVYIKDLWRYKPDFIIIKRILGIGLPNAFENSVFQLGKVITQSLISTFGTVSIAANAAANTLTSMVYICGQSVGPAMTTVVGRCIGAGDREQAKIYTRRLVGTVYVMMFFVAGILILLASPLVGLFSLSEEASAIAIRLILLHNLCAMILHPTAFALTNAFRAASDVTHTMIVSMVSMWIFRVGGAFFFAKYLGLGVLGVWLGMFSDWFFRAVMFGARYLRGRWLTKYKALDLK